MKISDGMLVSREYLERLDAAVFGTTRATPKKKKARVGGELWGKMSPAYLSNTFLKDGARIIWRRGWNAAGELYVINAPFGVDYRPEKIKGRVYWPYLDRAKEWVPDYSTDETNYFAENAWAVWRGRWEVVNHKTKQPKVAATFYGHTGGRSYLTAAASSGAGVPPRQQGQAHYNNPGYLKFTIGINSTIKSIETKIESKQFYFLSGGE